MCEVSVGEPLDVSIGVVLYRERRPGGREAVSLVGRCDRRLDGAFSTDPSVRTTLVPR
jgi:hypothetical protein